MQSNWVNQSILLAVWCHFIRRVYKKSVCLYLKEFEVGLYCYWIWMLSCNLLKTRFYHIQKQNGVDTIYGMLLCCFISNWLQKSVWFVSWGYQQWVARALASCKLDCWNQDLFLGDYNKFVSPHTLKVTAATHVRNPFRSIWCRGLDRSQRPNRYYITGHKIRNKHLGSIYVFGNDMYGAGHTAWTINDNAYVRRILKTTAWVNRRCISPHEG